MRLLSPISAGLFVWVVGVTAQAGPKANSNAMRPWGNSLQQASQRLDALVLVQLAKLGQEVNPSLDDGRFARRIYLDAAGRIPIAAELSAFLADERPDKRARIIDALLDSPAYVSSMFHFWADLLRAKTKLNNNVSGVPYLHWIKQSLTENVPYDEMVRDLLSSDGPAHKRDNGATGYYLRDRGMPLDNMANTLRIFLGTRRECAQCHNHPFDRWTQQDFFKLSAFSGGIKYKHDVKSTPEAQRLAGIVREMRQKYGKLGQGAINKFLRPYNSGISGNGTGVIRLPHDYQYDDARPNQVIIGESIFGDPVELAVDRRRVGREGVGRKKDKGKAKKPRPVRAAEIGSRATFAEWVTSPNNPRFTRVIVNRLWKRALGRGLIEPVDDLRDETEGSNPILLTYLEELLVQLDYDIKSFMRVLYTSQTYQREVTPRLVGPDELYAFPGPVLRRMRAEELWDSLLTLTIPQLDEKLRDPGAKAESVYARYEEIVAMTPDQLEEKVKLGMLRRSDPKAYKMQMKEARQEEAAERKQAQAANRKAAKPLYRQLLKARRVQDQAEVKRLVAKLEAKGLPIPGRKRAKKRNTRGKTQLVRASDLPSPAPPGHFLRQFGQSDRDQIMAAHTQPTVPQVLNLLNGFLEQYVLQNADAVLMQALSKEETPRAKVKLAYLSLLSRQPTLHERALWEGLVRNQGEAASKDLVWTLANSHEFRFVQ